MQLGPNFSRAHLRLAPLTLSEGVAEPLDSVEIRQPKKFDSEAALSELHQQGYRFTCYETKGHFRTRRKEPSLEAATKFLKKGFQYDYARSLEMVDPRGQKKSFRRPGHLKLWLRYRNLGNQSYSALEQILTNRKKQTYLRSEPTLDRYVRLLAKIAAEQSSSDTERAEMIRKVDRKASSFFKSFDIPQPGRRGRLVRLTFAQREASFELLEDVVQGNLSETQLKDCLADLSKRVKKGRFPWLSLEQLFRQPEVIAGLSELRTADWNLYGVCVRLFAKAPVAFQEFDHLKELGGLMAEDNRERDRELLGDAVEWLNTHGTWAPLEPDEAWRSILEFSVLESCERIPQAKELGRRLPEDPGLHSALAKLRENDSALLKHCLQASDADFTDYEDLLRLGQGHSLLAQLEPDSREQSLLASLITVVPESAGVLYEARELDPELFEGALQKLLANGGSDPLEVWRDLSRGLLLGSSSSDVEIRQEEGYLVIGDMLLPHES